MDDTTTYLHSDAFSPVNHVEKMTLKIRHDDEGRQVDLEPEFPFTFHDLVIQLPQNFFT